MAEFAVRFSIGNLYISGMIGILVIIKRILRNSLTSRAQYHLWILLVGLLAVPFIPFQLSGFTQILPWFNRLKNISAFNLERSVKHADLMASGITDPLNDLAISVSRETPSVIGIILCAIWLIGIIAMTVLVIRSGNHLNMLRKSALPLQNKEVRRLYENCLNELNITKTIPVYSTAFLKTPIIVGLFHPCIYLPIHLISDNQSKAIQYMILHELQHYKHKDALVNYIMNLAGILYWFNPFVWYALKEMRNEKEVACDASVLKMLDPDLYKDYGNTLIDFAEKISLTPFPFTVGLGGDKKQIERRVIHISAYERPTAYKRFKSAVVFILTSMLLLGLSPLLSTYAADGSRYMWETSSKNVSVRDFSAYFRNYEGSFVLYDSSDDSWSIYNMDLATLRVSPDSTYKIYDALFGLEEGVITPQSSLIQWNNTIYPFEVWNADQSLRSAMNNSVNWYFQTLDQQLGAYTLNSYIHRIGYGNELIGKDLSSYWLESSLKVSPIEQVELLTMLYNNDFDFNPENIKAVMDSIRLSSSDTCTFYGKTGTGRVDDQDVNGWFVGYLETAGNTYFFATIIRSASNADGNSAAEITLSILSDLNIWSDRIE